MLLTARPPAGGGVALISNYVAAPGVLSTADLRYTDITRPATARASSTSPG